MIKLELPKDLFLPYGDLLFMKYKDSQIKIKDHFKLAQGKTPPTKNPEYYQNGTLPWLNGGKLTNLYLLTDETKPTKLISEKAQKECRLLKAQPNSIVFSNVGTDKDRLVWVGSLNTPFFLGEHIWQINSPNVLMTTTLFFKFETIKLCCLFCWQCLFRSSKGFANKYETKLSFWP